MLILLFSFLLVFQTALCMTESADNKNAKPLSKSELTQTNAFFCISLDQALESRRYEKVQAVFDKETKNVDVKAVLNCIDREGDTMLTGAVKKGCGLDILKLLRNYDAQFCGIAGEKPTLRRALLNRLYTAKECQKIATWLIQEDTYVPTYTIKDGCISSQDPIILNFIDSVHMDDAVGCVLVGKVLLFFSELFKSMAESQTVA